MGTFLWEIIWLYKTKVDSLHYFIYCYKFTFIWAHSLYLRKKQESKFSSKSQQSQCHVHTISHLAAALSKGFSNYFFFLAQGTIERLGVSKKAREGGGSEWGVHPSSLVNYYIFCYYAVDWGRGRSYGMSRSAWRPKHAKCSDFSNIPFKFLSMKDTTKINDLV